MYLDFFVDSYHIWEHLFSFWAFQSGLKLMISEFHQNMVYESKSANSCCRACWVHVCDRTSISNMRLQQKIWLSITWAGSYSFWIICKVHRTIFNSLKRCGMVMHSIKHPIFPIYSSAWTIFITSSGNFKGVPIMSIFCEKLKHICSHVNDDRGIVNNIML